MAHSCIKHHAVDLQEEWITLFAVAAQVIKLKSDCAVGNKQQCMRKYACWMEPAGVSFFTRVNVSA